MAGEFLIFQLGTNNWQRGGEFAPGSGILHEAHHRAYNSMPGVRSYSMYPSKVQRFEAEDVKVFELCHDIPICESISPVSSYRWHRMSEADFDGYRARLTAEVEAWIAEIEARTGSYFGLAIAHHSFLNPVVMRDVIRRRRADGKPSMPLATFVHGTALKMYVNERAGDQPEEYPLRFLPFIEKEKVFSGDDHGQAVDLCLAISNQQVEAFLDVFPSFPRERIVVTPNGYNQDVFRLIMAPEDVYQKRAAVLADFQTCPYEGSRHPAVPIEVEGGFDAVVIFCGKFADWKRLDAVLQAAAIYEQRQDRRIVTLVVGSGPHEDQVKMQDLALEKLGLKRTFFLGPRGQEELATLFNCADVGCFPSYREPFGLVFIECMACGTPVIGADSGGPRDFVSSEVGHLVAESDDRNELVHSLAEAISRAVDEDWKRTKGPMAATVAKRDYSVAGQVEKLLMTVERLT